MFYIGEILKTRGNNGEVVIRTSPDFIYDNQSIRSFQLESKKYSRTEAVEWIKSIGDDLLVKFKNHDSIASAYKLIGYLVYLKDAIEAEQFIKETLVDYRVIDLSGDQWGIVINDLDEGYNHILEVDNQGEILYIPYTEAIIKEIDQDKMTIHIDPPDGLKDLNR